MTNGPTFEPWVRLTLSITILALVPLAPLVAPRPTKMWFEKERVCVPMVVHAPGKPFASGAVRPVNVFAVRFSFTQNGNAPEPDVAALAPPGLDR